MGSLAAYRLRRRCCRAHVGGQFVTTRVRNVARISHRLQQGFGAATIVFAAATYLQYDTLITAWVSEFYPNGQLGL